MSFYLHAYEFQLIQGEKDYFHIEEKEAFDLEDIRLPITSTYEVFENVSFASFVFDEKNSQAGHIDARRAGFFTPSAATIKFKSCTVHFNGCVRTDGIQWHLRNFEPLGYQEGTAATLTFQLLHSPDLIENKVTNEVIFLFKTSYPNIRSDITRSWKIPELKTYSDLSTNFRPGYFYNNYLAFKSTIPRQRTETLRVEYYAANLSTITQKPVFSYPGTERILILDSNVENKVSLATFVFKNTYATNVLYHDNVLNKNKTETIRALLAEDKDLKRQSATALFLVPQFNYYDLPNITLSIKTDHPDVSLVFNSNRATQVYLSTEGLTSLLLNANLANQSKNGVFNYQKPYAVSYSFDITEVFYVKVPNSTQLLNGSDGATSVHLVLDKDEYPNFLYRKLHRNSKVISQSTRVFFEDDQVTFTLGLLDQITSTITDVDGLLARFETDAEPLTIQLLFNFPRLTGATQVININNQTTYVIKPGNPTSKTFDYLLTKDKPTALISLNIKENDFVDIYPYDFHVASLFKPNTSKMLFSVNGSALAGSQSYRILNHDNYSVSLTFLDPYIQEFQKTSFRYQTLHSALANPVTYTWQSIFMRSDGQTSLIDATYTFSNGVFHASSGSITRLIDKATLNKPTSVSVVFGDQLGQGRGTLVLNLIPALTTPALPKQTFSQAFLQQIPKIEFTPNVVSFYDLDPTGSIKIKLSESVKSTAILNLKLLGPSPSFLHLGSVVTPVLNTSIVFLPGNLGTTRLIDLFISDDKRQFGVETYNVKATLSYLEYRLPSVTSLLGTKTIESYDDVTLRIQDQTRSISVSFYQNNPSNSLKLPIRIEEPASFVALFVLPAQPSTLTKFDLRITPTHPTSYGNSLISISPTEVAFDFKNWKTGVSVVLNMLSDKTLTFHHTYSATLSTSQPSASYKPANFSFIRLDDDLVEPAFNSRSVKEGLSSVFGLSLNKSINNLTATFFVSVKKANVASRQINLINRAGTSSLFSEIGDLYRSQDTKMLFNGSNWNVSQTFGIGVGKNSYFNDNVTATFHVTLNYTNTLLEPGFRGSFFTKTFGIVDSNTELLQVKINPSPLFIQEGASKVFSLTLQTFPFNVSSLTLSMDSLDKYLLFDRATRTSINFKSSNWQVPQPLTIKRVKDEVLHLLDSTERFKINNQYLLNPMTYLVRLSPITKTTMTVGLKNTYTQGATDSVSIMFDQHPDSPATFRISFTHPSFYPSFLSFNNGKTFSVLDQKNWNLERVKLSIPKDNFWGQFETRFKVEENLDNYLTYAKPIIIQHNPTLVISDHAFGATNDLDIYTVNESSTGLYVVNLSATPLSPITATIQLTHDTKYPVSALWTNNNKNAWNAPTGTTKYQFKLHVGNDDFYDVQRKLTLLFNFKVEKNQSASHVMKYVIDNDDKITANWRLSSQVVTKNFNTKLAFTHYEPKELSLSISLNRSVVDSIELGDFNAQNDPFDFSNIKPLKFDSSNWNTAQVVTFTLKENTFSKYVSYIRFGITPNINLNKFLNVVSVTPGISLQINVSKQNLNFENASSTISLYEGKPFLDQFKNDIVKINSQFVTFTISDSIDDLVTLTFDPFLAQSTSNDQNGRLIAPFSSTNTQASANIDIRAINNLYPSPENLTGTISLQAKNGTFVIYVNYKDDEPYDIDYQLSTNTIFKSIKDGLVLKARLKASPFGDENVTVNIDVKPASHVTFGKQLIFTKNNWNVYQNVQFKPIYSDSIASNTKLTVTFKLNSSGLSSNNPWRLATQPLTALTLNFINTEYLNLKITKTHEQITEGKTVVFHISTTNFEKTKSPYVTLTLDANLSNFQFGFKPGTQVIFSARVTRTSIAFFTRRNTEDEGNQTAIFNFRLLDQPSLSTQSVLIQEYNIKKISACGFRNRKVSPSSKDFSQAYVSSLYQLLCARDLVFLKDKITNDFIDATIINPTDSGTKLSPLYAGYTAAPVSKYAIFFDDDNDQEPDFSIDSVTGDIYQSDIYFRKIDSIDSLSSVLKSAIGITEYTTPQIIYTTKPTIVFVTSGPTPSTFDLYLSENQGRVITKLFTVSNTKDATCTQLGCTRTIGHDQYTKQMRYGATQSIFISGSLGQSLNVYVQSALSMESADFSKSYVRIGDVVKARILFKTDKPISDVKLKMLNHQGLRLIGGAQVYKKDQKLSTIREVKSELGKNNEQLLAIGNFSTTDVSATFVLEYHLSVGLAAKLKNKAISHSLIFTIDDRDATALKQVEFQLRLDPIFDSSLLFGKVFVDKNGNGIQDQANERGLADVEIITEQGHVVKTDQYGRYSIAAVTPGRHHIRLNQHTLGDQYFIERYSQLVNAVNAPVKANFAVQEVKMNLEHSSLKPYYKDDNYEIYKYAEQKPFIELILKDAQPEMYLFNLLQPITFRVYTNYIYYIDNWKINIFDEDNNMHTLSGRQKDLLNAIEWDGKNEQGIPYFLKENKRYFYELIIENKNGQIFKTPKYTFKVRVDDIYEQADKKTNTQQEAFYHIDLSQKIEFIQNAYTIAIKGDKIGKIAIGDIYIHGISEFTKHHPNQKIELIIPNNLKAIKVLLD